MAKQRWIQSAIKRPGAFRRKARRAGMSTRAYAEYVVSHPNQFDTRTKRQARLALTLMRLSKRR